jgi:alkanesulfonate monooxygenase SsuD/methylene tetrahydromethanopterin reductase-like flavin-dependent oxidoreductase (luciferase family)
VRVVCAETTEEAERIASSQNLSRVLSVQGKRAGLLPPEEAMAYEYSPEELAYLKQYRRTAVVGDRERVRVKLQEVAETYETMDLAIVTNCYSFADRVRSFELVAEVCRVKPRD